MKKRILSILLTCIMVIGMLPAAVFAADAAPAETPVVVPEGYVGVEIPVSKEVNNYNFEAEFSFTIQKAVKANLTVVPEDIDMQVLENKVKVSGGYSTEDKVTIAVPAEKAREFAANYTVTIEEVDEGELGWTYDKNVATVTFKYGNDGLEVDSISNSVHSGVDRIAYFVNAYDLVKLTVPFKKVVEVAGEGEAPEEDFTFEAYVLSDNGWIYDEVDEDKICGAIEAGAEAYATAVVETTGAGEYAGAIDLYFTSNELDGFAKVIVIVEKDGGTMHWTYAENAFAVMITPPSDVNAFDGYTPEDVFCTVAYYEAKVDGTSVEFDAGENDAMGEGEVLTFTNTYNAPVVEEPEEVIKDIRILLRKVFNVAASATEGGSISKPGISKVFFKHAIKYTITPAEGYEIEAVYVDGKNVGAVESYIFRDVTKDHTINAVFAAVEG